MIKQVAASPPAVQPYQFVDHQNVLISPPNVQSVILQGVSWATYEQLLADFVDSHAAHFAYDEGVLEIMVLSVQHEALKHALALLVEVVAEERNLDIHGLGSTTFSRPDLKRGFEPDACFYLENAELIRAKRKIDLLTDPPPELVIEIDITIPSLDKFPIFAAVGVLEVWRYDGEAVTIATLGSNNYQVRQESVIFPGVTSQMLTQFIDASTELKRPVWLRRLREWLRAHESSSDEA